MDIKSWHLVDPDLLPAVEAKPTLELDAGCLAEAREALLRQKATAPIPRDLPVFVSEVQVETDAGAVPLIVYTPAGNWGRLPALYHIHGGGFVMGTAAMNEAQHRRLCAELECVVVAVDYRLSPETSFPGPLDDCYAGLDWLFRQAESLNIDPGRIGVMGESAGGGLAAGLALLARDRGEFKLSFQHLIYPMLDDRASGLADPHPHVGEFVWTRQHNDYGWSSYLGSAGGDSVPIYAAPARAADLSGLPPTFISVGALDLFLEEDIDFARRLTRAGVPVEMHIYPGAFHGYLAASAARISMQAERESTESLRRNLHG